MTVSGVEAPSFWPDITGRNECLRADVCTSRGLSDARLYLDAIFAVINRIISLEKRGRLRAYSWISDTTKEIEEDELMTMIGRKFS